MVELIREFAPEVISGDERRYVARAYGAQQPDGGPWDGWLVFFPEDGGPPLVGDRETSQSSRADLLYWALGVEPIYLEGALERVMRASPGHLFRREPWGALAAKLAGEEEIAYRLGREHLAEEGRSVPAQD